MRINWPVDRFKDFCGCKAGLSSGVEGETYNFQCLSLFSRHLYLQWLGEASISQRRIRIKRFHLHKVTGCGLLANDPSPR